MIQFHRPLRAVWALPLLCAVGCKAQTPSDSPTPPVAPPPAQDTAAGSTQPSPTSAQEPADGPAPECGPMIPPAPPGCDRDAWFCNGVGDCRCQNQPGSVAAPGSVAPGVLARPAPEAAEEAPGDVQAKPPGSSCAGASVSAPQGDCLVANWYCNASGLCRCRA